MSALHVACLGAGRMGRGIALVFALAGHRVTLVDVKERSPDGYAQTRRAVSDEIKSTLAALAQAGETRAADAAAVLARVAVVQRLEAGDALRDTAILFEGVPEVMETKRAALAAVADLIGEETIIASTSSTFLSTEIAALVATPGRCLNAHFLNPAYVIPLVEVSPHPGTDPAVTERLIAILESAGKVAVRCAAAPGYIVPRLQALIMNEAARMIEQGVATAADIDRAVRFGLGLRFANMGVVEFIDFGGNDILFHASKYLTAALGDDRYASPEIVDRYMKEDRNGLRSGRGFYDWRGLDLDAYRRALLARLLAQARANAVEAPAPRTAAGAFSGKVDTGFPPENATKYEP